MINYYHKFIPNFADMTATFSELLKKGQPAKIVWTEDHEKLLQQIKTLFSTYPILKLPDISKDFVLQTDASLHAISAVLLQLHEGKLHPILYFSKKLSETQRNYAVTELEALALLESIEKFSRYLLGRKFLVLSDNKPLQIFKSGHPKNSRIHRWSLQNYAVTELEALALLESIEKFSRYLLGRKFLVLSDNKPLQIFKSGHPKNSRIHRWSLLLQDYEFDICHIPGKDNNLADILSRL